MAILRLQTSALWHVRRTDKITVNFKSPSLLFYFPGISALYAKIFFLFQTIYSHTIL
jgi:hypothetical protein